MSPQRTAAAQSASKRRSPLITGRIIALAALAALPWLALAAVAAEHWLYSRHTLQENGRWLAGKRTGVLGLVGDKSVLRSRSPLARGALDLGRWWGFQEFLRERPVELRELSLRFRLPPEGYLDVLVDGGERGLRLSRRRDLPGMTFRKDRARRFLSSAPHEAAIEDGEWHRLALRPGEAALDGRKIAALELGHGPRRFGFRSGYKGAEVDDVLAVDAAGRAELEDFSHRRGWGAAFAWAAAACAAAALALSAGIGAGRAALLAAGSALAALVLLCFDRAAWAPRDRDGQEGPALYMPARFDALLTLERARLSLFRARQPAARAPEYPEQLYRRPIYARGGELRAGGPRPGAKRGPRLVFLGSSQALGVGAERLEDTTFARVHAALSLRHPGLESLNLADSGAQPADMLAAYRRALDFSPDLVVAILGHNGGADDLQLLLGALLPMNRSRGIATVLLKEAICPEDAESRALIRSKHAVVARFGRSHGVPVLDLDAHLAAPERQSSGQLWWDWVHLTSHGQALAADWLAPQLSPLLPGRARAR